MNPTPGPRFPQIPLNHVPINGARPRVLHVSTERALALTRSAILQRAGFRVQTAYATGEAARLLHENDYVAVIVGHSLSREQKAHVIGAARAASSAPWIVGLYSLSSTEASGAHVAVDTHDGPQAVVDALRRVGDKPGRIARRKKARR